MHVDVRKLLEDSMILRNLPANVLQAYVRHFPADKGKHRLINTLWKPLSMGYWQRTTKLRDTDLVVSCDLRKLIQRELFFYGSYERRFTSMWRKEARNARVIFDIGANVGLYSLLAATENRSASIHAFEPTPELGVILRENLARNRIGNVRHEALAIGDCAGKAVLNLCEGKGGNEGMNFVTREATRDRLTTIEVPIVTLDAYAAKHGIDMIDLMKIDIEGGEFNALVGAQGLLSKRAISTIFLELIEWAANRYGRSTADIKGYLVDAGYELFERRGDVLEPIVGKGPHTGSPDVVARARR